MFSTGFSSGERALLRHWSEQQWRARQGEQADVAGDFQTSSGLVPARPVQRDDGMGPRRDAAADLGKVQVHRLDVGAGEHEGGPDAPRGAYRTEQIGRGAALIPVCAGTAALVGPDIGQASLLANARFILPPEFNGLAFGLFREGCCDQIGEVFLCASPAPASCAGCRGRTETLEKPSRTKSLPTVRSCVFHAMMGTDSTRRWAVIPRDRGQV